MPGVSGICWMLDNDLAGALASGELAPATNGGVTIGVVQHGVRRGVAPEATNECSGSGSGAPSRAPYL